MGIFDMAWLSHDLQPEEYVVVPTARVMQPSEALVDDAATPDTPH